MPLSAYLPCLPCAPAEEAEQASPCICTPRELAAQAACFLNMLLDMFGAAEEAGGFQGTAGYRWGVGGWAERSRSHWLAGWLGCGGRSGR